MKECFVIMPIGQGNAYEVYRNRYENIIEPAVESLTVDGEDGSLWIATQGGLIHHHDGVLANVGPVAGLTPPRIWPVAVARSNERWSERLIEPLGLLQPVAASD